jgi:hypothetical protein
MKLRRALNSLLAAILSAAPAWSQTVTETFDAGIPSSWTIVDNHMVVPGVPDSSAVPWVLNTAEALDNYTNGTPSPVATASSYNHPGQYDISLITPAFVLNAGVDGRSLRYDINYQRADATEYFDTNLSINGGEWITMTHDMADLGPAYSTGPPRITRGIDLTFFGAVVGDTARVEFRYYSTFLLPMVRNEYVQIDNVRTPTYIPEPAAAGGWLGFILLAARRGRLARRPNRRC